MQVGTDPIGQVMQRIRDKVGQPRIELGALAKGVIVSLSPNGKDIGHVTDMAVSQKTRDGVTKTRITILVER